MGTTVVGAYVNGSRIGIASVGDSRAYKISSGVIEQLTSDHTIVQQLVDAGHLDPQDALLHPQSHVLTRCLGSEISFAIDLKMMWLWPNKLGQPGDVMVLCSDGLYSMVSDQEICEIIGQMSPHAAVPRLIALARERGGFDNITVIIVALNGKLHSRPPAAPAEPQIEPRSAIDPTNHRQKREYIETSRVVPARAKRAGFGRHIRNLVLLGALAGFAAAVSFAILLILRG
jgi:serine/threonine protein phosphatase PrpC